MEYVILTEEEKERVGTANLVELLLCQGEELEPSGSERRWRRHDSVTVRNNTWYWYSYNYRGSTIQFLQEFYDMTYVEAIECLLEGNYQPVIRETGDGNTYLKAKSRKEFQLPGLYKNEKRALAYLSRTRFVDYEILMFFIERGVIYEEMRRHNTVFAGFGNQGKARHAHMKGTYTDGESFRLNVKGSDPAYGSGYCGEGPRLYVFGTAIDLLSFLTLYPLEWKGQSYIYLDGLSEHAMLQMPHSRPWLQEVILCMDHDPAEIKGCYRLKEILEGEGYKNMPRLLFRNKDWDEDLKEMHGIHPAPAREYPGLLTCMKLCLWLKNQEDKLCTDEEALKQIQDPFHHLSMAMERQVTYGEDHGVEMLMCLEDMSAPGLHLLLKNRRSEEPFCTKEQLANQLSKSYQPHRDGGRMRVKLEELKMTAEFTCPLDMQKCAKENMETGTGSFRTFIMACMKCYIQISKIAKEQQQESNRNMTVTCMEGIQEQEV